MFNAPFWSALISLPVEERKSPLLVLLPRYCSCLPIGSRASASHLLVYLSSCSTKSIPTISHLYLRYEANLAKGIWIRNTFHIKKSALTSFLTSFLICHFIYVTYTFGCKDNKKQGKKYTLPILFSHLGLNLRIIITIIYFVLNVSTENKPYTYIRTQKTPRSSQTREQELINQIHYSITFCFSLKAHHMKNNA